MPDYLLPSLEERVERRSALAEVLSELIMNATGPIRWVGCGPMTELMTLLSIAPEFAEQLMITQMGGWLDRYRDPLRASHNFHTDSLSAALALRILPTPRLVLSEHTNHDDIRVTPDWALIHALDADSAPEWARLLSAHFHRWCVRRDGSWMHDPLTLAAAMGYTFVTFTKDRVRIGDDARLYRDPYGRPMWVSTGVDYASFVDWMHRVVSDW